MFCKHNLNARILGYIQNTCFRLCTSEPGHTSHACNGLHARFLFLEQAESVYTNRHASRCVYKAMYTKHYLVLCMIEAITNVAFGLWSINNNPPRWASIFRDPTYIMKFVYYVLWILLFAVGRGRRSGLVSRPFRSIGSLGAGTSSVCASIL